MSRETYVSTVNGLILKCKDGEYTQEYIDWVNSKNTKASIWEGYGSDALPGGVNGIVNHADGKRYDSKSQYERAVRAKGCRIVGNDWNNAQLKSTPMERGIRGDFNVRPQLKEAVQRVLGT